MKGYKAFDKGLICRGKQYAENTVFEEDKAEICKSGMHFCKDPLDVLDYYPLVNDNGDISEFAEVEALDEVFTDDNKKYCTKKLRVGAKLGLAGFIKAAVNITRSSTINEAKNRQKDNLTKSGGDNSTLAGGVGSKLAGGVGSTLAGGVGSTLAGGDYSKLAGGYNSKLAGGNWSKLAGGDDSKLAGGYNSKLAGGYNSKLAGGVGSTLAGGDDSKLAGGDNSKLAGGDNSKLAGGNWSKLAGGYNSKLAGGVGSTLAGGDDSKLAGGNWSKLAGGEHSLMIGDNGSVAKGKKGALIVLVERKWVNHKYVIKSFKAELVDGERIKEDTYYKLIDGEFTETKD